MTASATLYSADSPDESIELDRISLKGLSERQLLWVDLHSPTEAELLQVATVLDCDPQLLHESAKADTRPGLVNYGDFFRITAHGVDLASGAERPKRNSLTLIVGPNHVVSLRDPGANFFEALRDREQGDTGIGALSSESFAASLLDWLLDTYFESIDALVREVDRVEVAILDNQAADEFLPSLVRSRRQLSGLRRALKAHRDVFHGLARPDFTATERPEARPHFEALGKHYERAEDELETARDLVVGSFELLSTRAAQKTNETMRVLTFVTVLMGCLALMAGIMGMNFELPFYQTGVRGFLIVSGSMVALSALAVWIAWKRDWV